MVIEVRFIEREEQMNKKEIDFMLKQLNIIISDLTLKSHSYESAKIVNESLRLRFELLKYEDGCEIEQNDKPLVDPKVLCSTYYKGKMEDEKP